MTNLYTVTLSDLGTYTVTVAADSEDEACAIAKLVLTEESTAPPKGITIAAREVDATALPALTQPVRSYDVRATYSVDFSIRVPAKNSEEAELNARRIYANNRFPFEYDVHEDDVKWRYVQEVTS